MPARLRDPDVAAVIEQYRTCEFATLSRSGVPMAWPTLPLYRPNQDTFVITTSIGLPQKAYNVRRDRRVALLFSDPTGSGLDGAPEVLVQAEAYCSELVTSPEGLEDYWVRLFERQPVGRSYGDSALGRWAMDWYYRRLVISISPRRVHTRASLRAGAGQVMPSVSGSRGTFRAAAHRMSQFDSAVLVTKDDHGVPWLLRVRPVPDPNSGTFTVQVPADEPVAAGPASLLCHSHNEQTWRLRSVAIAGSVARRDGLSAFTPSRVVPGADGNPWHAVRTLQKSRQAAKRYLQRRRQQPPDIPWTAYAPMKVEAARRQAEAARERANAAFGESKARGGL